MYILGVVVSFPSCGVGLVLKCMVFVNDVDQTAASREAGVFRSDTNFVQAYYMFSRVIVVTSRLY